MLTLKTTHFRIAHPAEDRRATLLALTTEAGNTYTFELSPPLLHRLNNALMDAEFDVREAAKRRGAHASSVSREASAPRQPTPAQP